MAGSTLEGEARVGIGPAGTVPNVALLAEIWIGAVKQEPVEEVGFIDDMWKENATVEAGGVDGPAVLEEKFEEGDLLVGGRAKDVVGSLADNGRANGEEIACDVDVASLKGGSKAVVEEGACTGLEWGLGDDGLDGGEGAVLAGGFEGGDVDLLLVNGAVTTRVNGEVVVA